MRVVKILFHDDGEKADSPKWHLVNSFGDSARALCTGECFGVGEGGAVFKEKELKKGSITCPRCIEMLKFYKSVLL
jgi:hypothetical protein